MSELFNQTLIWSSFISDLNKKKASLSQVSKIAFDQVTWKPKVTTHCTSWCDFGSLNFKNLNAKTDANQVDISSKVQEWWMFRCKTKNSGKKHTVIYNLI